MSKFHINNEGKPMICKATKGECPFGQHFGNKAIVYVYMRYGYDEDEIETVLFEILEGGNLGECDYWEVEED
jgi:hypothetical protein